MEKWIMEIQVYNQGTKRNEWKAVHPSGGKPYEYTDKAEASRMLNMCYGSLTADQARIRNIGANNNG